MTTNDAMIHFILTTLTGFCLAFYIIGIIGFFQAVYRLIKKLIRRIKKKDDTDTGEVQEAEISR